ncbi:hypothetical protein AO361_00190 [Pseudomonas fluorescens]|nr:hypothetical protein AO361_00190 [Pseudomonas fluorescens]
MPSGKRSRGYWPTTHRTHPRVSQSLNPCALQGFLCLALASLGIDLNKVEVGANLGCHSGRPSLVI